MSATFPAMPGNWAPPTTAISPNPLKPGGSIQPISDPSYFSSLWGGVTSVGSWLKSVAESPYYGYKDAKSFVSNTVKASEKFVASAESNAKAAAVGVTSTVKYVAIGAIALAVVYVVAVLAPALKK